ncbi:hypothetical protein ILYODFUR_004248 [Ilyodon furcidens]|uniref:Uncharacterized protein n=1 Tax=Ilyodon furcidens TaxID=33524 RepID=A0ABV0TRT0_9TELE
MLKRPVNHDSPTTSRDLRYSGPISPTPEALPPRSFLTTSVTSAWVMKESNPESPASVSTRECVMAGLRRSSKYSFHVPSRGQQPPIPTVNSVDEALLPPPEAPDGLPESLQCQPVGLLHGLTELLPGPGFCHCHSQGRGTLGLMVPVSRLRSPTSITQPMAILLQLDSIPYCRFPPRGSGIAPRTGTADLTATATGGSIKNRCGEHGPLGLYVFNAPLNLVKALPQVGVESIPGPGLRQMFPAEPHYTLERAKSVWLSSLPADPTHHQVMISGQLGLSLHPSV